MGEVGGCVCVASRCGCVLMSGCVGNMSVGVDVGWVSTCGCG